MTSVFPVAYFGNIAYFQELVRAENPIIETKEHFVKQTIRTRCEIPTANGVLQLTVPVIRKDGSKTTMENLEISFDTDWRKSHWKAIESAYASAPFFEYYGMEVQELIYQGEKNLVQFDLNCTQRILDWLSIDTALMRSLEYSDSSAVNDFRTTNFSKPKEMVFYQQVFAKPPEFITNLSILDLIFCEGPMARKWIISS